MYGFRSSKTRTSRRWKGRIRCGPYRSDGESSDVIRRVTEVRGAALLRMTIKERSAVIR